MLQLNITGLPTFKRFISCFVVICRGDNADNMLSQPVVLPDSPTSKITRKFAEIRNESESLLALCNHEIQEMITKCSLFAPRRPKTMHSQMKVH